MDRVALRLAFKSTLDLGKPEQPEVRTTLQQRGVAKFAAVTFAVTMCDWRNVSLALALFSISPGGSAMYQMESSTPLREYFCNCSCYACKEKLYTEDSKKLLVQ